MTLLSLSPHPTRLSFVAWSPGSAGPRRRPSQSHRPWPRGWGGDGSPGPWEGGGGWAEHPYSWIQIQESSTHQLCNINRCLPLTEPQSVQFLSRVLLFATICTAARQASLSFPVSQSLLKLMCIELVMPSNHLILCLPHVLLPSILLQSTHLLNGGEGGFPAVGR